MAHDEEAMDTTELVAGQAGQDLHAQVMSRYGNSSALEHRHLCAVVSAMAEVIKEQGMPATPTAFFAASMSALDRQCKSMQLDHNDHVSTALCTFLALTLPKISPAVLRSKGPAALALIVSIIGHGTLSPGGLKPSFTCIAALLQVIDTSDWSQFASAFNVLLTHCLDLRPKVRKRAHECTTDALRGFQNSASLSMASEAIVILFERSFLAVSQYKGGSSGDKTLGKSGNTEALQILYMLNALKLCLPLLSGKSMGKMLGFFSKLLELRQPFLSRQIFNTLQPLCTDSTAEIPPAALCDLLEKIAGMILEEKKAGDESMVAARVLAKGMERLHAIDPRACALKLPLTFQSLAGMLVFEQEEAVFAAADCLKSLIENCIDNAMIEQGKSALQSRGKSLNLVPTSVERICVTASSLLGYQFSTAWDVCLQVVASLFDKLGGASFVLMASTVQALADLEGLSDENLTCRRQLHKTVGAAVAAMGPENFLTLLPLNLDGSDMQNARIWLLPILRQNVVGAQLRFFSDKMLPLIQRLQDESKKLSAEGKLTAAKKTEAYVQSLWALFPAFCNFPSDTTRSFGRVAKFVGGVLSEDPDLRGVICQGLQMLIKQNRAALGELVASTVNAEDSIGMASVNKAAEEKAKALYVESTARANLAAIGSFSKNFLPLLFNVFIAAPPEKRGMLQATIGELASISEKKVVRDFFVSIMQKLLKATKEAGDTAKIKGAEPMDLSGPKEESASSKRCIFMDLALSLLRGLDDESVGVLFTAIKPTLQDGDGLVQKKGYKVLAGLCKEHTGFLAIRCNDVLELMLMAMPACHFSAKRQRLNCLHPLILHTFKSENQDANKILSSFIGEIILATKEANIKTRNTSYEILVQLGHSLKDADPVGCDGKLIQFFTMIVGCLAGTTPHMRSAAITGLARLIYEFHDLCHTIPDLLPSVLLFLQSKSREVIKSVLGFLKVVVARQPAEQLQHHLKSMVEGLLLWSDDSKNHFKAKVRVIFEMLVRRCGLQAVSAVTPEQHAKLLTHIRKMKERKEKKEGDDSQSVRSHATTARQSKWQHTQFFSDEDDEGGSDDNNTDQLTITTAPKSRATTTRSNRKLRKASKMLPEDDWDGEDEPLDLLDAQKTRSVLSVNKLKRKNYESDDDLEVDPDGRLIVPDENSAKRKGKDFGDRDTDMRSTKSGKSAGKVKPKVHATKKRKTDTGWAHTGHEYASKKGARRGDVKREGKVDPYAYWPLDPKMLNRREGKKAVARKGLASVAKVTNKMKGMSASEALGMKHSRKEAFGLKHAGTKGKQKFHKGKGKSKRR